MDKSFIPGIAHHEISPFGGVTVPDLWWSILTWTSPCDTSPNRVDVSKNPPKRNNNRQKNQWFDHSEGLKAKSISEYTWVSCLGIFVCYIWVTYIKTHRTYVLPWRNMWISSASHHSKFLWKKKGQQIWLWYLAHVVLDIWFSLIIHQTARFGSNLPFLVDRNEPFKKKTITLPSLANSQLKGEEV